MAKRTRSVDSGYESNDDEQNLYSKRTRITTKRWITTTNDFDRTVRKSPEKEKFKRRIILCDDDFNETPNSSISNRKSPEKFKRRIILCDDDLNQTPNSSFSSITSESDDLDSSFLEYEELKTDSTFSFKQKHIIEDGKARKMLLNIGSKTVLKNKKKNSVKVFSHSSFYQALYQGCSKEAQSRLDSMMKIGYFPLGHKRIAKCRRNSVILSVQRGIVVHIQKLKNGTHDFELCFEVNEELKDYFGFTKNGKINHFGPKKLY